MRPATHSATIAAVLAPTPGRSRSVPASARDRTSSAVEAQQGRGRAAVGLDPVGVGESALQQEGDPTQHRHRVGRTCSVMASWCAPREDSTVRFVFSVHTVCTVILAGQRRGVRASRARPPQALSTAPHRSRPQAVHDGPQCIHRFIHRGGRTSVDPVPAPPLRWSADEALGRFGAALARGRQAAHR